MIESPQIWDKLNLRIDRAIFIENLNIVREIRNDIMHFNPEGITDEQMQSLKNMANVVKELVEHS